MIANEELFLDLQSNIISYIKQSAIIAVTNSFRTKITNLTKDKIQPVLQRFKLRSCNFLIVEQTNFMSFYNP